MPDLTQFGTLARPLRCSALPLLVTCPLRAAMLYIDESSDVSGKAADTGSAVHKAIATWHRNNHDYTAAVLAMKDAIGEYPLADFGDAELHFRPYTKDPRNKEAELLLVEEPVRFTLQPAESDPTQAEIVIRGTLDQVRIWNGMPAVLDVKTGKAHGGWEMMQSFALQIAAYAVGATARLGRTVLPGAIIRTYGYRVRGAEKPENRPGGVFYEYAWGLDQADLLLDSVRNAVALVRSSRPVAGPGEHCGYCPAGGLDNCLPRLETLRVKRVSPPGVAGPSPLVVGASWCWPDN